jgi:hypothetical protein
MASVELKFRQTGALYSVQSDDDRISIVNSDKAKILAQLVQLVEARRVQGVWCRVDAYAPLGPALALLRNAGAICRVGLKDPPGSNGPAPPVELARERWQMPGAPTPEAPPPLYKSWSDYLNSTTRSERMVRCNAAAKKANRKRLLSAAPQSQLSGTDVWQVFEDARGRCVHCGSLAVESRPSGPNGAPVAWAQVGRRIGSLEHPRPRMIGGDNFRENLAWACLWCNTWEGERRPNALDHGGLYPEDS